MASTDLEQQRDIASLIHPYTDLSAFREQGPTILTKGKGVYVYDDTGRRYIEGLAGLWCTALGYGNEKLIEAATKQLETLSYTHLFGGKSHEPAIQLAEKIKQLAPCPVSKVLFTCSGSEANDTQVKLAWYYNNARGKPEKKKIISRIKGYHGVTVASGSLTGLPNNHLDFDLPYGDRFVYADCPHHYRFGEPGESERDFSARLAENLDAQIQAEGPDTIAAFIAEPVMGAGGVIVPPEGYFPAIQAVLNKYDILFIADEVITGFGRLGTMFGSEALSIKPDSLSMAKALTSAYAPLGALTISEPMFEAMMAESEKIGTFGHGFTYGGHPLGAAIGVKALEIYERDDIPGRVAGIAPQFQARLKALADHPMVGEARGMGLIGGLELVADKGTKTPFDPAMKVGPRTAALIQEEGLIVRPIGDTLGLCPPLIITEEQIDEMFDALTRGLDAAEEMVRAQGLRAA
ncbi:aminotransferase [Methyloligella sp. 2.7D]|uniref:aminotransferase n=1 Tax=unclassified Methyloligella TaxID=2625955 RepID=UPI00157CDB60|nr:aminotransferase [Methyloligella sp. GL2]QKP78253.1 aminotransferase class III-fold pyridoxal phosphate-dependent enzyme [Methyloligella sp. GL2]